MDSRSITTSSTTVTQIEYITRNFKWKYGGEGYSFTIHIPEPLYKYYREQPHDRKIAKYAITDKDRKVLDNIISSFRGRADSKIEAAHNIVAFVQSLPYSTDYNSTGLGEYPRYPIETIIDGRGDCEDTAILTAALLKEMGYDVVLISPPGHMAVGITCDGCSGPTLPYKNKEYYYLETTGSNWKVGQIPVQYRDELTTIYPI